MKTLFGFGSVMALAMTSMACSQSADAPAASSSTLEVTGTVDTHLRTLDNASAVAIGSDGKTFSAYVERNGHFKLSLPVGHVYRVVVANATMTGELRTVGHLVNNTSNGKSDVIAVKKGGKLDLGRVAPAGTSASTLKTACDCDESGSSGKPGADGSSKGSDGSDDSKGSDDSSSKTPDDGKDSSGTGTTGSDSSSKGDDSDDDYACHQKDQDKDSLCSEASDDVELTAEKSPGDACAKGDSDEDAPAPASKSCTAPDNDKDGKDDTSDPSSGSKDTSGDDSDKSSSAEPDGKGGGSADPSGGKSAPGTDVSCKCSSQCGAGSSCVASHCLADN